MFSRPVTFGRATIHPGRKRKATDHMGRFGGGWQWKVGVQAGQKGEDGSQSFLIALLVDEYRVAIAPRKQR